MSTVARYGISNPNATNAALATGNSITSFSSQCSRSLKVRLHSAVLHPVHMQLEHQVRTLDLHMQLEVQVVELNALGGCEAGEQALRHGVQVGGELADVDEVLVESIWRTVFFAGDQVVFYDQ